MKFQTRSLISNSKGNSSKYPKGNKSKKMFLNFHHVIFSLSSISCLSLNLLAVMFFLDIKFYMSKFANNNN